MASITISEQQLQTWANYVQLNKNKETYEKVKSIFRGATFNDSNNFEIYLQGSVANNTNIWADGDIDIVLQFNGTFYYNYSYQPSIYNNPSNYTQQQFRQEVMKILYDQGVSYKEKNKCIELYIGGENSNYQNVDLIPCFQYKNHWGHEENQYYEGIKILTLNNETIINYPKLHRANGEEKNKATGNYKKVVRIFKNIKKKLVEEYSFDEKLAPSYFIECLLYNVPNEKFNGSFTDILCNCINWIAYKDFQDIQNFENIENLKCQNGITDLFGDDSTQWNLENCKKFINEVIEYITK